MPSAAAAASIPGLKRDANPKLAVTPGTWKVDPGRSSVEFKLRHLMVVPVRGRFTGFAGTLVVARDGSGRGEGEVRADTIDTGDAIRDERLRGPDFFDVASFPEIGFACTRVEALDGRTLRLVGELTIRGATREVELRAHRAAAGERTVELELGGELRRSDFGIESEQLLEAGISDKVELALRIVLERAAAGRDGAARREAASRRG